MRAVRLLQLLRRSAVWHEDVPEDELCTSVFSLDEKFIEKFVKLVKAIFPILFSKLTVTPIQLYIKIKTCSSKIL